MSRCTTLGSGSSCKQYTTIKLEESSCYQYCCRDATFDKNACLRNNQELRLRSEKIDSVVFMSNFTLTQFWLYAHWFSSQSSLPFLPKISSSLINNPNFRQQKLHLLGNRQNTKIINVKFVNNMEQSWRLIVSIIFIWSASKRAWVTNKSEVNA